SLSHISGATLLIARRRRSLGWEATVTGIGGRAEHVKVYYMEKPRGVEGMEAIIVDDVVIEGDTLESLIDIAGKSGLVICCMYSIYGIGGSWKKRLPVLSVLYEAPV
nr:hypothetical protein [Desulfurococcales archaeon]